MFYSFRLANSWADVVTAFESGRRTSQFFRPDRAAPAATDPGKARQMRLKAEVYLAVEKVIEDLVTKLNHEGDLAREAAGLRENIRMERGLNFFIQGLILFKTKGFGEKGFEYVTGRVLEFFSGASGKITAPAITPPPLEDGAGGDGARAKGEEGV